MITMTDEKYLKACEALGQFSTQDFSKAVQTVLQEARQRTLESMETAHHEELAKLQAQAAQLHQVLRVLQGTSRTMTI